MANRPQTEKLAKLGLFMHECGRLYSARKPDAYCSKCGPDVEPIVAVKPKRSRKAKPVAAAPDVEEIAPPVTTGAQRQKNERAREARAARRAGLGAKLPQSL